MLIVVSAEAGLRRGLGAGGTKGAGLLSMSNSTLLIAVEACDRMRPVCRAFEQSGTRISGQQMAKILLCNRALLEQIPPELLHHIDLARILFGEVIPLRRDAR
jgi:hypothetical protein